MVAVMQPSFDLDGLPPRSVAPFRTQLLKWVGNKQRFAHEIASHFPAEIGTYFEPFLGSGAVLGTLAPERAIASDAFDALMGIWKALHDRPDQLVEWYASRWHRTMEGDKVEVYEEIKAAYNANPNPADLVFIARSCYGGVVRFRKADGYISTPCGVHRPVSPESFEKRVGIWRTRTEGAKFETMDFGEAMALAGPGDLVYCDPPYVDTQTILYGAQDFDLSRLFAEIENCKSGGAHVALSIDGTKRSGAKLCDVPIPDGLFESEVFVNCGRSMLRRFQMEGRSLEDEVVSDRLLLTF